MSVEEFKLKFGLKTLPLRKSGNPKSTALIMDFEHDGKPFRLITRSDFDLQGKVKDIQLNNFLADEETGVVIPRLYWLSNNAPLEVVATL